MKIDPAPRPLLETSAGVGRALIDPGGRRVEHRDVDMRSACATVAFVAPAALSIDTWPGRRRHAVELVELSAARAAVVALERLLTGTEVRLLCRVPVWSRIVDLDVAAVVRWRTEMHARDMILGRDCVLYGLELRPTPQQEHQLFQAVFCIERLQRETTASGAGEPAPVSEDASTAGGERRSFAGHRGAREVSSRSTGSSSAAMASETPVSRGSPKASANEAALRISDRVRVPTSQAWGELRPDSGP